MSWFEAARLRYIHAPFSNSREESEYRIPLHEWKTYCHEHDRSLYYHVAKAAQDVDQIIAKELGEFSVTIEGVCKKIVLSNVHIESAKVDAVVNAANETLLGGGGVDEAIHGGAGPNLIRECATLKGCHVAQAKVTKGYDLPSTFVIHTVAPILDHEGKPQPELLLACYIESLKKADEIGAESIVFPCLGCGFYGFPVELSARVVLPAVNHYLESSTGSVKTVIFSLFDDLQREHYLRSLGSLSARK